MPSRPPASVIPRRRKFDHGAALELAINGWRYSEIAARFGVAESSVQSALAKYQHIFHSLQHGELQAYRANRVELFTLAEREMMASLLDPGRIAKASLNNVAYAFQQVHTARRLEEGKSTDNKQIISAMLDRAYQDLYAPRKGNEDATKGQLPKGFPELPISPGREAGGRGD